MKFNKRKIALELKIWKGTRSIEKAKIQLERYLDKLRLKEGYLVVFDTRDKPWEEKLYFKDIQYNDKIIHIVGI